MFFTPRKLTAAVVQLIMVGDTMALFHLFRSVLLYARMPTSSFIIKGKVSVAVLSSRMKEEHVKQQAVNGTFIELCIEV